MKKKKSFLEHHPEAKGLLLLSLFLLMLLSLVSFAPHAPDENWLGLLGFAVGYSLTYLFGLGSFLVILYTGYLGIHFLRKAPPEHLKLKNLSFSICLVSICLLLNLMAENRWFFPSQLREQVLTETMILSLPYPQVVTRHNFGGVPLYYLYNDLPTVNLRHLLSNVGVGITFSITAFVSAFLFLELRFMTLALGIKKGCLWVGQQLGTSKSRVIERMQRPPTQKPSSPLMAEEEIAFSPIFPAQKPAPKKEIKIVKAAPAEPPASKREKALQAARVAGGDFAHFRLPPDTLLRNPRRVDLSTLKKDLRRQAEILEETLMSFGIEAKVGEIHPGPTITSFEVHPSVGVKVQKIKALEKDIALNLQASSIRIIAPIPGKAAVGVEVPSLVPQEVSFKELLLSYQQSRKKAEIPILLGKTVSGEMVISDLARMPHCLIAGATGSGKSVCINTIVMSIVMNARPDEVKLLMVDPKKVELTGYTKLPHMIAPVITEAHGAYAALSWLVKEMQLRYEILKQLKLRNIAAFNARKPNRQLEESLEIPIPEQMPKMVAIIDEFADLMMASSSDLETPIARIAQMARAVGIHLILATQRPSREVITGLIKANFPTRISFKVASRINSQIILDETGAESLLGNGDMLFLPPGSSHLTRAQGTYISDEEINNIVSFVCDQSPPQYLIPSFDTMPKEDLSELAGISDDSKDSLYDEALTTVVETGNASTTFLQRKLKIGYARAASLMDQLEQNQVISPQEGAKPRRVLMKAHELKPR